MDSLKSIFFGKNKIQFILLYFIFFSLSEITIPSTVSTIGSYAFSGCTSLTKIIMKPTTPPSIQANSFQNNGWMTIVVPKGSLNAYKTASNWSALATKMEEAEE